MTHTPLTGEDVEERLRSGASFAETTFGPLSLAGVRLVGCDLREALLDRVDLSGADLTGANLTKAVFTACNLTGVVADRAMLSTTHFIDCKLVNGWFAGVTMAGGGLLTCDVT